MGQVNGEHARHYTRTHTHKHMDGVKAGQENSSVTPDNLFIFYPLVIVVNLKTFYILRERAKKILEN